MSGITPTKRRERKRAPMRAWDEIFSDLEAKAGTERLQAQHKDLWERIRKRGSDMTEQEEQELHRLFRRVFPQLVEEELETEREDDNDPLKDLPKQKDRKDFPVSMSDVSRQQRFVREMGKPHVQPPIVYLILGFVCLGFWALGTSTQVLTSEAWMLHQSLSKISFNAFGQLWDALHGQLGGDMVVPFFFGWGVQLALIVSAIGVELPKRPAWRWWAATVSSFGLIITNSCGDFASSDGYGFWGQCGFTAVIFFLTFVMLLFAIMAFRHAFHLAKEHAKQMERQG
jgi:hypothetical protein